MQGEIQPPFHPLPLLRQEVRQRFETKNEIFELSFSGPDGVDFENCIDITFYDEPTPPKKDHAFPLTVYEAKGNIPLTHKSHFFLIK